MKHDFQKCARVRTDILLNNDLSASMRPRAWCARTEMQIVGDDRMYNVNFYFCKIVKQQATATIDIFNQEPNKDLKREHVDLFITNLTRTQKYIEHA